MSKVTSFNVIYYRTTCVGVFVVVVVLVLFMVEMNM